MSKLLYVVASVFLLCFGNANAEVAATPLSTDTRLVIFTYDQHNSFEIFSRPKSVTDIQFSSDERIKALALGDTIQWEVAKTGDGQHLFIKPKAENVHTSATIITDKRTYQLLLKSTTSEGKWYQRVTWEYPEMIMMDEIKSSDEPVDQSKTAGKLSPGTAVEDLNFEYQIEGDAAFKPVTVMDDSKFTFVRMPSKLQELPALFLVTPDGDSELINYIVRGDYLVVQRLFDRALLKIGKQEIKIINKTTVKRNFFDMFNSR